MEEPRIRFRQASGLSNEVENSRRTNYMENNTKVKIKSIVPINLPVKLLKSGKHILIKDQTQIHGSTESHYNTSTFSPFSISKVTNTLMNKNFDPPKLCNTNFTDELHKQTENNSSEMQNCTDRFETMTIEDSINKNSKILTTNLNNCIHTDIPYENYASNKDGNIKVIQVIDKPKPNDGQKSTTDKYKCTFQSKNISQSKLSKKNKKSYKENCSHGINGTGPIKVLIDRTKVNKKIHKNWNKSVYPLKKITKLQRKLKIMPYTKFVLTSSIKSNLPEKKIIEAPTKIIAFHDAEKHSNISLPQEIPCINLSMKMNDSKKVNNTISSKDLFCPEYNSSILVMKKLKEIEKEKIVTDIESLPTMYKNLINGRVS